MGQLTDIHTLVGGDWNMYFMTFHIYIYILGITIPTDELIFFRGVGIPPTSSNVNVLVSAFGFDFPSLSDLSGPLSYLFLFSCAEAMWDENIW